jgi:integrase/recombinase XerD
MTFVQPHAQWPCSDRAMWDALCKEAGPLDEPGGLAHLRQTSRDTLEARYARWLRWMAIDDPKALSLRPSERASVPRLQAWLDALGHTRPMSRLMYIDGVLRILREVAPEQDWSIQLRLLAHIKRIAGRGDPTRKNGRILSSGVLLDAGLRLATAIANDASTPLARMKHQRDGTMIALLAVLPMRRRSFCELAIDQSVHVSTTEIMISLSSDMTKTGVPWEAIVPRQVELVLRHYIDNVRPALLARGSLSHDILWVGKKGEILGMSYIGSLIGSLTLTLTGKRVPPHFFRDAAATTLARISPESAQLIRPVLAHSGFRTAERHYIHARTIDAGREYASLIKRIKGSRS